MPSRIKKLSKSKPCHKRPGHGFKCSLEEIYHLNKIRTIPVSKMMSKAERIPDPKCPYQNVGLSAKEKSYVICRCQTRSARYVLLKNLALNAIKEKKIFTIYGFCKVIRKELTERGWVEKYPSNQMNLSKLKKGAFKTQAQKESELEKLLLSNFVSKCPPNFIWHVSSNAFGRKIERSEDGTTIENRLTADCIWTTKQGLCSSMKRNYWFYVEDVSEVTAPRTYNTSDYCEVEDFDKDYKITACTSLLKWVLSMVSNQRPVFTDTGKISTNILVFAINRCKEYLFRKRNKDIDRKFNVVSDEQWNTFLRKYYLLIDKKEVFQTDVKEDKLGLYLGYTKYLLKEICRYRPQLNCEGYHNIWIIKPPHNCRGRGIKIASKLPEITDLVHKSNKTKFVIQKYIEEPLLIHDTKFDIRQYYLVTSTYPLVIWMYEDCYLKFSSQKYNIMDYHESIHLTNNAVQRKYKNCAERHPELPVENMWDLATYKSYLRSIGQNKTWHNVIYPGMRKAIISIMLSCQDSIPVSKNRFELYGCDFILDKMYTPWLIEINSCPDLEHTTSVTAKICPAVIADIVKVVIDYRIDENASTGNFECIYHQPMTTPRYGPAVDLCVRGYSLPYNYFYRGVVPKTNYDFDTNIDKEIVNNALEVSQELERYYDLNTINIYADDDDDASKSTNKPANSIITKTSVTSNLDDIMDNLSSERDNCLTRTQSNDSVSKIEAALKESMTRLASAVVTGCLQREESESMFRITEVNDNLKEVRIPSFNNIQNILKNYEIEQKEKLKSNKKLKTRTLQAAERSKSKNIILEATTDIVNFISKREKEYNVNYVNLTLNKPFN